MAIRNIGGSFENLNDRKVEVKPQENNQPSIFLTDEARQNGVPLNGVVNQVNVGGLTENGAINQVNVEGLTENGVVNKVEKQERPRMGLVDVLKEKKDDKLLDGKDFVDVKPPEGGVMGKLKKGSKLDDGVYHFGQEKGRIINLEDE